MRQGLIGSLSVQVSAFREPTDFNFIYLNTNFITRLYNLFGKAWGRKEILRTKP